VKIEPKSPYVVVNEGESPFRVGGWKSVTLGPTIPLLRPSAYHVEIGGMIRGSGEVAFYTRLENDSEYFTRSFGLETALSQRFTTFRCTTVVQRKAATPLLEFTRQVFEEDQALPTIELLVRCSGEPNPWAEIKFWRIAVWEI